MRRLGPRLLQQRKRQEAERAALAYADAVDRETSLVICNEHRPAQGKGYLAHELGVPMVSDAKFMDCVGSVVDGTGVDGIVVACAGEQFALF